LNVPAQFLLVTGFIFLVNLPFGYWRARTEKLSVPWFLAIHLPVGLTVGFRILAGIRFMFGGIPFFVGAFFLGQSLGGKIRIRRHLPHRTLHR
jgi:hypothetical protein